jgi:hypothetical protein
LAEVNPGTVVVVVVIVGADGFGADELQPAVTRIAAASSVEIFTALEYRPACAYLLQDSRLASAPATRVSPGRFLTGG